MQKFLNERVLSVQHWNEGLFSFTTTRDPSLRFENGQFIMVGLPVDGKPLMRAYSVASANWEETLEFFSIKVPDGPLTSRLQHLQPGDEVLLSKKPTGTLLIDDLHPGKRLYLLATGTGLAPYLAIAKDPRTYERFDTVILCHGTRFIADLAYREYLEKELPQHELLGETIREQFRYFPTVTREDFRHKGRLTKLLTDGTIPEEFGLPPLDPAEDRVMLCGSPDMLDEFRTLLDERGFRASQHIGDPGDYVFERAFAEH